MLYKVCSVDSCIIPLYIILLYNSSVILYCGYTSGVCAWG